ncbi:MAG: hypothetical protein E3J72_13030 [Planctomycetota bacterium]|nr:MAG: hypothetical protein E3J72_13030 [Planctomycetota bacterium]
MKLSLPIKLGIGVILLFTAVIAGMVFYKPILKLWKGSRQKSGIIHIRDDFSDGKLDGRLGCDTAGDCTIKETAESGVLRIDTGSRPSNAGIVYAKKPLDISKPITIKHRCRIKGAGGLHAWLALEIRQKTGPPECTGFEVLQRQQRICVAVRSSGEYQIGYWNNNNRGIHWDKAKKKWSTNTAIGFETDISVFHLIEFHSDKNGWYIVIKDKNGSILTRTSPVPWLKVKQSNEDYWFFFGIDCTDYFHGDGESDYIDIEFTPGKSKGPEKRR